MGGSEGAMRFRLGEDRKDKFLWPLWEGPNQSTGVGKSHLATFVNAVSRNLNISLLPKSLIVRLHELDIATRMRVHATYEVKPCLNSVVNHRLLQLLPSLRKGSTRRRRRPVHLRPHL